MNRMLSTVVPIVLYMQLAKQLLHQLDLDIYRYNIKYYLLEHVIQLLL